MTIRWCCAEFKESTGAGKVNLIGIRREESARRAKRNEVEIKSRKFSGNLDQFNQYRMDKHFNPIKRGRKPKEEKPKEFHPYDEAYEETLTSCISGKDSILISPIIDWTEDDVWEFLNNVMQVPHCELYDQGYHRIGCILCPMSSHKQKLREMKDFPYVKDKWLKTIKLIREGGVSQGEPISKTNATMAITDGFSAQKRVIGWHRKQNTGIWKGDYP